MRIAVTGASGFLGNVLLPTFSGRPDVSIVALTRTLPIKGPAYHANVKWLQGDLASPRDCQALVSGAEVLIHLAHTNTPLTSNRDLPSDVATNAVPTVTLLQAVREAGSRPHVVYASSGGALYAPPDDARPVDESAPCSPTTSYGIQKLLGEHYLRMAAHEGWLTATVLRIGNAYGLLLPTTRTQGFIGVAVARLRDGLPIRVFGDPDNVRDYVHLDDVCRMFAAACEPRRDFSIYNVGSGRGVSVRELLSLLGTVSGRELAVEHDTPTEDATRLPHWIVLDCTSAERELGWVPQVELEDGVRRLWNDASRT